MDDLGTGAGNLVRGRHAAAGDVLELARTSSSSMASACVATSFLEVEAARIECKPKTRCVRARDLRAKTSQVPAGRVLR